MEYNLLGPVNLTVCRSQPSESKAVMTMPRPQKRGLDYFPLDTNFFSDNKIRILKARYGVNGIMVYIYLLCEIYKNGYYLTWDSDQKYIMADELNLTDGFIEQVLAFLLERSLLESKLFLSDTVLTSPGIQRRFQLAVKERAKKTPVKIEGFWLLDEETTEPFIQVQLQAGNSVKNEDISRKNVDSSQEKSLKESKEKKSKGKQSKEGKSAAAKPPEPDRLIAECGFSLDLEEAVKDWMTYKAEKRQAYKETGFKNLLSQIKGNAERYGDWAVAQLIRECMASNWQGIIFDRLQKEKNSNRSGTGNGNGVDWSRV